MARHFLHWGSFALLAASSACERPAPAGPAPAAPPPQPTATATTPSPLAVDVPPVAPAPGEKFEAIRLELERDPYVASALPAGQRLRLGGDYAGASEKPARWLVHVPRGVALLDAATLKTLGTIDQADGPDDVFENVGLLPGWQGKKGKERRAALRFEDGKIVLPNAKLASGETVEVVNIIAGAKSDVVLVLGRAPSGALHYGRWVDAAAEVSLPHAALVNGTAAEWNPEAKAWELYGGEGVRTTGSPCARARLGLNGARCVLEPDRPGIALGGDWYTNEAQVFNPTTGTRHEPRAGENPPILVARLDSPPRALFATQPGDSDARTFELIGTQGSLGTWSASFPDRRSFASPIYPKDQAVVTESGLKSSDHVLSEFAIDLFAGKVFLTPPLDMIAVIGKTDRQFLAVRRGASEDELVVVDLAAKKLSAVGKLPSCRGIYWPDGARDGWLVASCDIQPNPSHMSLIHQWAVLVDTKRKRLFKTELTPFALRPASRFVFGTGKKRGAERVIKSGAVTLHDLSL